ncbi:MAG: PDZ domain-containing protein [Chloroflexi bacterium]|nr:PDZ domain-containing protein [Chloroflexota bacterium]
MNVSQIKVLAWLTALALGGLLSWILFDRLPDFRARVDPVTGNRIWRDEGRATTILNGIVPMDEAPVDLVPAKQVQQQFHDLNWTGVIVREPEPVAEVEKEPEAPAVVAMKELVRILMIREDTDGPTGSYVTLIYRPAAGVAGSSSGNRAASAATPSAPAPVQPGQGRPGQSPPRNAPIPAVISSGGGGAASLAALRSYSVGDHLEAPLEHVRVELISAHEGVTFAFEGDEREPETVKVNDPADSPSWIVVAEPGQEVRAARSGGIPTGDRSLAFGARTTRVGDDLFRLGLEDMDAIGNNYPAIISDEIGYQRYVDPRTKETGILLTKVKPGGMAARHGVKEGDVIKSINGHPVGSPQEAITFVKNNSDKYSIWHVVIVNLGQERTVVYESK